MPCFQAAFPASLRATAAAALALCAASGAWSQAATPEPQRIEIIGVTPLPGLGIPKDQVPANVQTARGADIEKSNALDLSSFMARKLGSVHVNEVQNNPFQPDVNFRGFTASPLLGTAQGLSVYVDGVRLNQPFGDVVSWDLIPKSAISSIALMPGSNPLFGLNTLGGALSVQTKDGLKNAGSSVQLIAGANHRVAAEFEHGGAAGNLNWFVTGNRFHEKGWRAASPSDVTQLYGKVGAKTAGGTLSLSAAVADNNLNGNGLQDFRLLDKDYSSVYTRPDNTKNKAFMLNLVATQALGGGLSLSGNAYARRLRTSTFNGDINEGSFDQATYLATTSTADRNALAAAGYSGLPTVTETAANTPFPKWRCIAQALLKDEPGEKCNGVINQAWTTQSNAGASGQISGELQGSVRQLWTAGAALDFSRVGFRQGSELGYLNPDRSVTGVGAYGDGVNGGNIDGAPYDTRVDLSARSSTWSLFASDTLNLNPQTALTVAARYNRNQVRTRDAITPGGGPGSLDGNHRFSRLNPALGLTFAATPAITVYGGVNQGSRAPSAIELGCADPDNPCKLPNAMAGDPPLKQVVTTTLEAGLRGSSGGVNWNVGLFRSDNQDDILFVANQASGFGYFKNFGKTRRQGLESGIAARLGDIGLSANYTYLDATYRSTETLLATGNSSNGDALAGFPGTDAGTITVQPGNHIPLMPQHVLKLSLEAALGGAFSVGADVTAVGSAYARGNENNQHQADGKYYLGNGRSAAYELLNLSAEWRPVPGLKVFMQVNNALDRHYATAAQLGATGLDANGNFVARPFPVNANGDRPVVHTTFFAPGAPRTLWLGLRYSFGG